MQHKKCSRGWSPVYWLTAAAASALSGCASDHYLGELAPVDPAPGEPAVGDLADESSSSGGSQEDFTVEPRLPVADFSMVDMNDYLIGGGRGAFALAAVGDVDGDGYADFATTAADWGGYERQAFVHLRYGGPRPHDVTGNFELREGGLRLTEDADAYDSIEGVTAAGDVDGDGYADFLVVIGLGSCVPAQAGEGVYLVYGSAERVEGVRSLTDSAVLLSTTHPGPTVAAHCMGRPSQEERPRFVAGIGDADGDGLDDFVVSEPRLLDSSSSDPSLVAESVAYVFYGSRERLQPGTLKVIADARLHAAQSLQVVSLGDANADHRADFVLGGWEQSPDPFSEVRDVPSPTAFYWVPGTAQRWSGDVSLDAVAIPLAGAQPAGDLDGDGVSDVLLYDDQRVPHLFYGEPGLFDDGAQFAAAAASFPDYGLVGNNALIPLNDRDGDGDDELVLKESIGSPGLRYHFDPQRVSFLSGTAVRRSGDVPFVAGFPDLAGGDTSSARQWEYVEGIFPVGDLDGDGVDDVITWSGYYGGPQDAPYDVPSLGADRADWQWGRMNVHYGKPGSSRSTLY